MCVLYNYGCDRLLAPVVTYKATIAVITSVDSYDQIIVDMLDLISQSSSSRKQHW